MPLMGVCGEGVLENIFHRLWVNHSYTSVWNGIWGNWDADLSLIAHCHYGHVPHNKDSTGHSDAWFWLQWPTADKGYLILIKVWFLVKNICPYKLTVSQGNRFTALSHFLMYHYWHCTPNDEQLRSHFCLSFHTTKESCQRSVYHYFSDFYSHDVVYSDSEISQHNGPSLMLVWIVVLQTPLP